MADIWVLTRSINDYNQDGEYFEMAWDHKPSLQELANQLVGRGEGDVMQAVSLLLHIEAGGGRQGFEDTWYHLRQVNSPANPVGHYSVKTSPKGFYIEKPDGEPLRVNGVIKIFKTSLKAENYMLNIRGEKK